MFRVHFEPGVLLQAVTSQAIVFVIVAIDLLLNVVANASFKVSAESTTARGFLTWQVVGNIAGLGTVIALTLLLRYLPLSVAYATVTGLSVICVQVFASVMLFGEAISRPQWLGTVLVVLGIMLICYR